MGPASRDEFALDNYSLKRGLNTETCEEQKTKRQMLVSWQLTQKTIPGSMTNQDMQYCSCGVGPTILFLHDCTSSHTLFMDALKEIASRGHCGVALDIPWLSTGRLQQTDFAKSVTEAVESLPLPQQFDLVGHGAGALLALQLARSSLGHRIRKLVLWGVPFLTERQLKQLRRADEYRTNLILSLGGGELESCLKGVQQPCLCMAGDGEQFQFPTVKAASLLSRGRYVHLGVSGADVALHGTKAYIDNIVEFLNGI